MKSCITGMFMERADTTTNKSMARNKSKKNSNKKLKHKNAPSLKQRLEKVNKKPKTGGNSKFDTSYLDAGIPMKTKVIYGLVFLLLVSGLLYMISHRQVDGYKEIQAHIKEVIKDKTSNWIYNYPGGFKIIAIYNNDVLQTEVDSLPKDLFVDWENTMLIRPNPLELKEHPGLAKIQLTSVTYEKAQINHATLVTAFLKQTGMTSPVSRLGDKTLYFQLVEAYENSLICLFGIK